MTALKVLRHARALYENAPSHAGPYELPDRDCVCPLWAIEDSAHLGDTARARELLQAAMGDPASIVAWTATHSTIEVLAAFDRAIIAELGLAAA